MIVLFALVNFGITLGYLFVATVVLPSIEVSRRWTKVASIVFFFTCGLTHLEMAVYALLLTHHHVFTTFTLVNHVVQVFAVWIFVVGLYLEFVKDPKIDDG